MRSGRVIAALAGQATFFASAKGVGPNASATANAIGIQAMLTAANALGGGTVYIDRPGVHQVDGSIKADTSSLHYSLNCALIIYSNTTLMMGDGASIKLADASNCYTIRNARGGHSTLRDSNIAIVGGKIDGNDTDASPGQTGDPRGLNYWKRHTVWIDQCDGFTASGVESISSRKFCWWVTRCTRVVAEYLYIHTTASDGFHIGGGNTGVIVQGCTITAHDNGVPIITNEGGYYTTVGGALAQYLDAPHGPTSKVVIRDCVFPYCFEPIRLAGGDGTPGTDNITDVLVENCSGTCATGSWFSTLDDTGVSPNIVGAYISNVVIRNCRFNVTAGNAGIYLNSNGTRDVRIENCYNPADSVTLSVTQVGGNATAFINGETVTESVSNATGIYIGETTSTTPDLLHVLAVSGTFTGTATRTLTGATSGAVRVNITTTAVIGQSLAQVGSRCTGMTRLSVSNCVDDRSYNAMVYNNGGAIASLVVTNNDLTLGASGRIVQTTTAIPDLVISGNRVKGVGGGTYTDAVLRLDSGGSATQATIAGNVFDSLDNIIYSNSTVLSTLNLSGNTFKGGTNSVMLYNQNTACAVTFEGDGNNYTGTWLAVGLVQAPTGTALRFNNPSLQFAGDYYTATPTKNHRFFNTRTSGSAPWTTLLNGVVNYNGTAWELSGRTV
jgi:hypothetical protein